MRKLIVWTLSLILMIHLTGCVKSETSTKLVINENLPKVSNIKTIVDINSIAFEWAVVKDSSVNGFYVYRKDGVNDLFTKIDTISSKYVTHYVDLGLKPNIEYTYKFTTFSKDKAESLPSKPVVVRTLSNFEPVSFITTISNMPRRIKVLWRPHTNLRVKSYSIERRKGAFFEEIATVDGRLQVEYIDSGLEDFKEYEYRVVANSFDDIKSIPSSSVKATTKELPPVVENLVASNNVAKKILLSWDLTNYADFNYYRVYASLKPDGAFKPIAKTKNIEFLDSINGDGQEMFYKVSIVDSDGLESPLQVNPISGTTLSKPTKPTIEFHTIDEGTILIRWSNSDRRVVGFIINKRAKEGIFNVKRSSFKVPLNQDTFRDSDVKEDVEYIYTIQSVDNYGIISEKTEEFSLSLVSKKR